MAASTAEIFATKDAEIARLRAELTTKKRPEIKITAEMIEAGYVAFLTERRRLEDGDDGDHTIALTSIFCAMWEARQVL
jgi:hypothetical protein